MRYTCLVATLMHVFCATAQAGDEVELSHESFGDWTLHCHPSSNECAIVQHIELASNPEIFADIKLVKENGQPPMFYVSIPKKSDQDIIGLIYDKKPLIGLRSLECVEHVCEGQSLYQGTLAHIFQLSGLIEITIPLEGSIQTVQVSKNGFETALDAMKSRLDFHAD